MVKDTFVNFASKCITVIFVNVCKLFLLTHTAVNRIIEMIKYTEGEN